MQMQNPTKILLELHAIILMCKDLKLARQLHQLSVALLTLYCSSVRPPDER